MIKKPSHKPLNGGGIGGKGKTKSKKSQQNKKQKNGKNNKKQKQDIPSSSLSWNAVPLPFEATAQAGQSDADFFEGFSVHDDDFMGLTEVEGVDVVRGTDGIIRFMVDKEEEKKKKNAKGKSKSITEGEEQGKETVKAPESSSKDAASGLTEEEPAAGLPRFDFDDEEEGESEEEVPKEDEDFNADFALLAEDSKVSKSDSPQWTQKDTTKKLPAWKKLDVKLHPSLYQSIHSLKFHNPTDIQSATLPISINSNRDVIGVAQTGSGKTLAYSLPILHWIASHSIEDRQMRLLDGVRDDEITCRLAGLILTPTRELAIQVAKHITSIIDHSFVGETTKKWASVATVTGGMSEEKQKRTLQGFRGRGTDIIVATPGRLWELCCGDDSLARRIKTTKFLVVDEADRMIETGHFAEMENIFALVHRIEDEQNENSAEKQNTIRKDNHLARVLGGANDMQTFIYSATLSKDLQQNLKRANRIKRRKKGKKIASTLDELLEAIDFRDDEPFMVDQSTLSRVATNVMEVKIECVAKEKDLYLYYFLLRYPGRTLVFVNSIDGIRRLQPLLQNLKINVQPLHSQLQQRQRLKNMDRFKSSNSNQSSILLATDVAARGLDIANVDHVVHFQVPRSADTYVHRSGRTARGGKDGVALVLIEPSEKRVWQDLCKALSIEKQQTRKDEIQSMPIEYTFLNALKQRINLAKQIDQATHKQKKANHDDAWLKKLAEEVEMDLSDVEEDAEEGKKSTKVKDNKKVLSLKFELERLIQIPLRARGISGKYLTSGSQEFVESLLNDQQHQNLIGVQKTTVQQDVGKPKQKRKASDDSQQKRKRV